MSENAEQSKTSTGLNKRSCDRCSQRKVRCDRIYPCSACIKAEVQCSYPGPKKARRTLNRPPVSELLARLKYLEEEVALLRSNSDSGHQISDTNGSPENKPARKPELLILKEGKSRYVGDEASIALGEQISELRDIIESSPDEEDYSLESASGLDLLAEHEILGGSNDTRSLHSFRLHYVQPSMVEALWKVYQDNVAPLIVIIHKPSMAKIIQNTCSGVELSLSDEALLFSIIFAAVVSMKPSVCSSILNVDHDVAAHDCKRAVSQAICRANLIKCQQLANLQAAVLSLLCCRVGGDTSLVWAESAIVIRVAQAQGVHRDGTNFGLSPFETEIRRRLWWHICMLDMLSSRDQGVDTQIRPEMFDTQLPTNVDDHDLHVQMIEPPKAKTGFTDITGCIMNSYIMNEILWSDHSGDSPDQSTEARSNHISALGERMHRKYLDHLNLDVPIQWVFATIIRLQLSQAWLAAHFQSGSSPPSFQHDDRVFGMAVEIVQFAYLLQTNDATSQWCWLCKSYKEWHVVAFILSELCIRPLDPVTDNAWDVVTKMYHLWQRNHSCSDALLERPLNRLMERTTASRAARREPDTVSVGAEAMTDMSFLNNDGALFELSELESFAGLDWLSNSIF